MWILVSSQKTVSYISISDTPKATCLIVIVIEHTALSEFLLIQDAEAAGINKLYLYRQVKAELSHWCNNLTWAGTGSRDSHHPDIDVHKRIDIGCRSVEILIGHI